jgi:5'-nucleotidase/UDP-sugar diphosphatase
MRKLLIFVVVLLVATFCSLAQAQIDTLTILHTNDTHAHLLPYGPKDSLGDWEWGGFSRIATIIGMDRMSEGKTLLLDAGDFSVGDFMFQEYLSIAELNIMKGLGYDAIALGNHEFDLFPSTLTYELAQTGLPDSATSILCANLDMSGDTILGQLVKPYAIKQVGSLKVGIMALLTETANQISNPTPVVVLPAQDEAQAWVDSLKAQNCDIIILLSHLGFDYDQMIASTVSGIDIIVGGHSHTELDEPVTIGNTLIVQAGEFGRFLGKLTLYLDSGKIQSWAYDLQSVDQDVPPVPSLDTLIGGLAMGVEADPRFGPVYTQNLATAGTELSKELGSGLLKDSPLGDMLADAFRATTGTDVAFQPQGFCAQTIYEGAVRGADIFQAVPYGFDTTSGLGFKLATFETDGASLVAALEFAVYNLPYSDDMVLHGSNIFYAYNSANPPGSRVDVSSILVNGQPLSFTATYTVTTSDAATSFVSQIPGFKISNLVITDDFVYTVAKNFMMAHTPVFYYTEGRVIDLAPYASPLTGVMDLMDVVDQFVADHTIDNMGIANSLKAQLNATLSALKADRSKVAVNTLKAFTNHVSAQSGKHITEESASRLIFLASNLSTAIQPTVMATTFSGQDAGLPTSVQLCQNYPNPFNPTTVISYTLPAAAQVRLTVLNLLGQEVKVLVNDFVEAGSHNATWDGRGADGQSVASGIYFYRIHAGSCLETRKMLLLK